MKRKPPTITTRERILDAAARLFHEQGFAATGISTLLREADVNSGSLYHFFASKEALLSGVLERYTEMLDPIVLAPRERAEKDPIERVFTLLAWYRGGLLQSGCGLGCPIGNLALELSDTYPEIRPMIRRNFDGWKAGVQRWLEEAGARLPDDVDRGELAAFVLTVMEGGIMQARAERSLAPFDASVAQLRSYFDMLVERARLARSHERKRVAKSRTLRKRTR